MAPSAKPLAPLLLHNTTAEPLSVDVCGRSSGASPPLPPPLRSEFSPRSSAHIGLLPSSRARLELKVTRANGETVVFVDDRKARRRGRQGWSQMTAVVSSLTARSDTWPAHGASSDSTSTLDAPLPKASWPLTAFYCKASHSVTLASTPPLHAWMSALPDSASLGDVTLPGTHQSTALYGFPVSQCQQPSTPLAVQLQDGIRFLDVRLAEKHGKLIAYHGILTQRANFEDLLTQVKAFLTAPESDRETVVMSIQQENATTPLFLALLRAYVAASPPSLWFLANRIPTLAECRGKIVLFSRFGGDGSGWEAIGGMGIHPVGWRDSVREGFELRLPDREKGGGREGEEGWGWTLGIQDWYNIGSVLSIPEKAAAVASLVARESPAERHVPLAFCSAASFPLACPVYVARGFGLSFGGLGVAGVNARVGAWLLEALRLAGGGGDGDDSGDEKQAAAAAAAAVVERKKALRGWLLFDFYRSEPGLVGLVVAFNFL